ncbi:fumarylacetoacetate hydrolase family protein [Nocardia sp. NPDC057030]|uniref:fumarylacetoacetate hydrolase family protein n=1 Tax=unclassified Nocardia TaxID=2637762 RepID=UPI00363B4086
MKFVSFRTKAGESGAGAITSDGVRVLSINPDAGGSPSPIKRLLASTDGRLASLERRLDNAPLLPVEDVILDVPVPDPSKIVAAPVNYRDHQTEMHHPTHIDSLGVFLKAPSSLLPPGGTIVLPYHGRRFDQEGELALVIGKEARHVAVADALDYVAGYTGLLDMTMRGSEDRSMRKSFDTFTPMGPYLVTPDEAGPVHELSLRCWVDGALRQDASIGELIWDVPTLVSYVSSVMHLHPGDVISTGTPAGVGEVVHGQRIDLAISGFGELHVFVDSSTATVCPTRPAG